MRRRRQAGRAPVVVNLSDSPAAPPGAAGEILLTTSRELPHAGMLRPWEGIVIRT
jgi:hypothetical protein